MKVRRMIVNRISEWYQFADVTSDPSYMAMLLLEKLSTRLRLGVVYDRMKITSSLINQRNSAAINVADNAIMLLISRGLITIEAKKNFEKTLIITELGQKAFADYKEVLKNVD